MHEDAGLGSGWFDQGIDADAKELRGKFKALWDSLHGHEHGPGWHSNPEIIALTFTVHRCNIDVRREAQ